MNGSADINDYEKIIKVKSTVYGHGEFQRLDIASKKTGRTCIYKYQIEGSRTRAGLYLVAHRDGIFEMEIGGYKFEYNHHDDSVKTLSINDNVTNRRYENLAKTGHFNNAIYATLAFLTGLVTVTGLDTTNPEELEARKAEMAKAAQALFEIDELGVF